jgi:hypothetical protein
LPDLVTPAGIDTDRANDPTALVHLTLDRVFGAGRPFCEIEAAVMG